MFLSLSENETATCGLNHAIVVASFAMGLLVSGLPLAVLSFMLSNELNRLNSFEGLNLTVDKGSYKLGATIEVTLENRFDREIFVFTLHYFEVQQWNGSWASLYAYALPEYFALLYQGIQGVPQALSVSNNTSLKTHWNQTMTNLSYNYSTTPPMPVLSYAQALVGRYRLKMTIALRYGSFEGAGPEDTIPIYSGEFSIG